MDYMPGMGDPINVGTWGGKSFNAPIFVASGGYVPFKAFDDRKRALQGAARAKLKEDERFKFAAPVGPPQYDEKIKEQYYKETTQFIDEAMAAYSESAGGPQGVLDMMRNPDNKLGIDFQKHQDNWTAVANNWKNMVAVSEQILKDDADPTKFVSPETSAAAEALRNGLEWNSKSKYGQPSLNELYNGLISHKSYDKSIQEYAGTITPDQNVMAEIEIAMSNGDYDVVEQLSKKALDPTRALALAEQWINGNQSLAKARGVTKEIVAQTLTDFKGQQITNEYKTPGKRSSYNVTVNGPQEKSTTTIAKDLRSNMETTQKAVSEIIARNRANGVPDSITRKQVRDARFGGTVIVAGDGTEWSMMEAIPDDFYKNDLTGTARQKYGAVGMLNIAAGGSEAKPTNVNERNLRFLSPVTSELVRDGGFSDKSFQAVPAEFFAVLLDSQGRVVSEDDEISGRATGVHPGVLIEYTITGVTGEDGKTQRTEDLIRAKMAGKAVTKEEIEFGSKATQTFDLTNINSAAALDAVFGESMQGYHLKILGKNPIESKVNTPEPIQYNANSPTPPVKAGQPSAGGPSWRSQ